MKANISGLDVHPAIANYTQQTILNQLIITHEKNYHVNTRLFYFIANCM